MPETEFHADYEFLNRSERLTHEEILKVGRVAATLGASKIRLTGGEPLLRAELPKLIEMLAALPAIRDLAMTTNGVQLAQHVEELASAGLKRINISLDTLDAEKFQAITRRGVLPESGGTWLLPRLIGWAKASEIIFTGRTLSAADCLELGLVNRVVPDSELLPTARQLAAEIAANGPLAVRAAIFDITEETVRHLRDRKLILRAEP